MVESYHSRLGILNSHKFTYVIYWVKNRAISYKDINSEDKPYKSVPSLLLSQLIILLTSQVYLSRQKTTSLELSPLGFEPQMQSLTLQNELQP